MKRVVLIGDSIRLRGYGPLIAELLGDDYSVWQSEDNGRFALYTFQSLQLYMNQIGGADVVHWNNGNWDMDDIYGDGPMMTEDEYCKTLMRIAKVLKAHARKIIFATTTPVKSEYSMSDNERIQRYNARAVECLRPMGIEINDLYPIVFADMDRYLSAEDYIHLTKEGAAVCAAAVCASIQKCCK